MSRSIADRIPPGLSPEETQAWADKLTQADKKAKPLANFTRADQVEVRPVDWLVAGWIAQDSLAGAVGPSGSCKTFYALDVACCVATKTAWNGCEVTQGAVFVLAGEGRNGLRKRIEGWSVHNGVSIEGAPLYLASSLPKLTEMTNVAGIIAEIDQVVEQLVHDNNGITPALIVIDTVARAMSGENENSAEVMGALIANMDWLRERWPGCTVLSVHHTGHDIQSRARGSSAYYAALDSEVVLKPVKSGDVQLFATKGKDWDLARPMQFRRQTVDITIPGTTATTSTLVLVDTGSVSTPVDRKAEVREMKAQGKSVREIAKETGIPRSTVDRLLKSEKPIWKVEFGDDDD